MTFWLESSVVGTQIAAAPPTNEQLLTQACSYCMIATTTTSPLEGAHGRVLSEVPVQEGDEQHPGHYDEEGPPGYSGCMSSLLHKDVSDRQSSIVWCFPETVA